jgi:hypothetical protein
MAMSAFLYLAELQNGPEYNKPATVCILTKGVGKSIAASGLHIFYSAIDDQLF